MDPSDKIEKMDTTNLEKDDKSTILEKDDKSIKDTPSDQPIQIKRCFSFRDYGSYPSNVTSKKRGSSDI